MLKLTDENYIEEIKDIVIKNPKKLRFHGPNIVSVEDKDNIYYILICKSSSFESYLAFSNELPQIGMGIECTRIICNYGWWCEQNIVTHRIIYYRKLTENLYKVRTKHTYYIMVK